MLNGRSLPPPLQSLPEEAPSTVWDSHTTGGGCSEKQGARYLWLDPWASPKQMPDIQAGVLPLTGPGSCQHPHCPACGRRWVWGQVQA